MAHTSIAYRCTFGKSRMSNEWPNPARKRLEQLQGSVDGWSHDRLVKTLELYGFTQKRETRHGTLMRHPNYIEWATVIIPRHRNCRKWVAQEVLDCIERLLTAEEE